MDEPSIIQCLQGETTIDKLRQTRVAVGPTGWQDLVWGHFITNNTKLK